MEARHVGTESGEGTEIFILNNNITVASVVYSIFLYVSSIELNISIDHLI